jgi:hypothetical protein
MAVQRIALEGSAHQFQALVIVAFNRIPIAVNAPPHQSSFNFQVILSSWSTSTRPLPHQELQDGLRLRKNVSVCETKVSGTRYLQFDSKHRFSDHFFLIHLYMIALSDVCQRLAPLFQSY